MRQSLAAELGETSADVEELAGVAVQKKLLHLRWGQRSGLGFRSARFLIQSLTVPWRAKEGSDVWKKEHQSSLQRG